MASGLEILGGVAAAVELTKLMAKFIRNFGTMQNAPRQVKRLDRILDDLNDVHLVQAASPKERRRIWELVRVAEGTLERSLSQSPNVLLQFFWPEELEKQLKEQNDELQSELITLGLRVDRRRWAEYLRHHPVPGFDNPTSISPGGTGLTLPPPYSSPESHPPHPPGQVAGPSSPNPESDSTKRLRLPAKLWALPSPRISSSTLKLGLVLDRYLQNPAGTNVIPSLEVKYYQVLERDDETRLIQYERKTDHHHIQVTHRIPRSCLRFEDDNPHDTEVHFLDAHPLTLVRSGTGHEVYFCHTKYKFSSVEARELFLAHMLERKLLGRFYVEEVRWRGELYARGKVIRIWKKGEEISPSPSPSPSRTQSGAQSGAQSGTPSGTQTGTGTGTGSVKLTFLARQEKQCEWDLTRLSRTVLLNGDWVTLFECGVDGEILDAATLDIKFRHSEEPMNNNNNKRRKSVAVTAAVAGDSEDADPDTKKISWKDRVRSFSVPKYYPGKIKTPKSSSSSLDASTPVIRQEVDVTEGGSLKTSSPKSTESKEIKSDAERFRELFQRVHPSSAGELRLIPPMRQTPALGMNIDLGTGDVI